MEKTDLQEFIREKADIVIDKLPSNEVCPSSSVIVNDIKSVPK